jgi:hypothetical protein
MATVQDPEVAGISVSALKASASLSPKLFKLFDSIQKADHDNDGFLSPGELVNIIQVGLILFIVCIS